MGTFGILARKGLVCLAAALTLIAGAPHFECHCPGGQVKPICLGTAAPSRCCCGGACCRDMTGRGCCCRRKAPCRGQDETPQHPLASPGGECLAQGRGCVKTLAPRLPLVVPSSPVAGAERLVPVAFVAAVLLPAPARAAGPSEGTSTWVPCHAPPRDQLLRLCRLLI